MLIEDYDWTGFGFRSALIRFAERASNGVLKLHDVRRLQPGLDGRRLASDMEAAGGLADVTVEGRLRVIAPDHPGFRLLHPLARPAPRAPAVNHGGADGAADARTRSPPVWSRETCCDHAWRWMAAAGLKT